MVRLKVVFPDDDPTKVCKFQFHYGTIKSEYRQKHSFPLSEFQFHYGTIKSQWESPNPSTFNVFQFHYGTIKSNCILVKHFILYISIPLWYD